MSRDRNAIQEKTVSFKQIIRTFIMGNILLLILIGLITSNNIIKYGFSSNIVNEVFRNSPTKTLVNIIGLENHYFLQELPKEANDDSLYSIAFELLTSIKLGDIRSLVGRELPGFSLFDTEIVVAGEGTNFTNIPMESAPPLDVMLTEREIAEENLKIDETNDSVTPPSKTTDGKIVFIYQSHSTESFLPLLKNVTDINSAHSTDSRANMIMIGNKLTKELEERGIGVKHDTSNMGQLLLNRGWNYGASYNLSREIVKSVMANNDGLKYLIDLHRDTARKKITTTTINGQPYARLFFIVGKEHNKYEESLRTAKELNTELEKQFPGISRGIFVKTKDDGNGVYNQDLSENAILIEVGGVDNTLDELYRTVGAFADIFGKYYWESRNAVPQ